MASIDYSVADNTDLQLSMLSMRVNSQEPKEDKINKDGVEVFNPLADWPFTVTYQCQVYADQSDVTAIQPQPHDVVKKTSVSNLSFNGASAFGVFVSIPLKYWTETSYSISPRDIQGSKLATVNIDVVAQSPLAYFDWDSEDLNTWRMLITSESKCTSASVLSVQSNMQTRILTPNGRPSFRNETRVVSEIIHYNVTGITNLNGKLGRYAHTNGSMNGASAGNIGTHLINSFVLMHQQLTPFGDQGGKFIKERREYASIGPWVQSDLNS